MHTYIIWTLSEKTYHQSNGIRALHILANHLREKGYTVHKYIRFPNKNDTDYISDVTKDMQLNAIIIYPEIIEGNPLQFKNVVRFVLNTPRFLDKNHLFHKSEVVFSWDKLFFPNVPILNYSTIDSGLFYNNNSKKIQNCSFIYKKGKFRHVKELEGQNIVEITIDYPPTRQELANLLRTTDTLYSFDDCTILLEEAKLCGAKVKIITENSIIDAPDNKFFSKELTENTINNFILNTQSMNYNGKLQSNIKIKIKHILKLFFFIFVLNIKCIKDQIRLLKCYK